MYTSGALHICFNSSKIFEKFPQGHNNLHSIEKTTSLVREQQPLCRRMCFTQLFLKEIEVSGGDSQTIILDDRKFKGLEIQFVSVPLETEYVSIIHSALPVNADESNFMAQQMNFTA